MYSWMYSYIDEKFFLSIFFEHNFEKFGFVTIWLFVKDAFLVDVWGVLKPAIHPFRGDSNFSQLFGNRGDFPLRLVDWWAFCNLSVAPFELVSVLDFNRGTGPGIDFAILPDVRISFLSFLLCSFVIESFLFVPLVFMRVFCRFICLHSVSFTLWYCMALWYNWKTELFYFDVDQVGRFIFCCFTLMSLSLTVSFVIVLTIVADRWLFLCPIPRDWHPHVRFWTAHVNICQWNKKMYRCKLHVY